MLGREWSFLELAEILNTLVVILTLGALKIKKLNLQTA